MKRPTRGSGAPPADTKLSGTIGGVTNGVQSSSVEQIDHVVNKRDRSLTVAARKGSQQQESQQQGPLEQGGAAVSTRRYLVISTLEEVPPVPPRSTAVAAGNLLDEQELLRVKPIIERIASAQKHPHILVAGFDADRVLRTASASKLRRSLEDLGAVFVERPQEADTPEAIAAFLDREYAPDLAAVAAALAPPPPITVVKDHDITPYLQTRPDIAGDLYFMSHKPASELKKR